MRCYWQSGQSLDKGRGGKMQTDLQYIFVMNGEVVKKRGMFICF